MQLFNWQKYQNFFALLIYIVISALYSYIYKLVNPSDQYFKMLCYWYLRILYFIFFQFLPVVVKNVSFLVKSSAIKI